MATWSTLHIFGYGETQLIGEDFNKKVLTSELTKVQAVVDNLYSFKPEDSTATEDYHLVNVFKDKQGSYVPKDTEQWRVEYTELDLIAIEELVAEIEAYIPVAE
jgi:hypothetical protein